MANSFFKNGDKGYTENLNDSILVGNAFDWTVDVSLPTDTGGVFPNDDSVVKGKVADLSITPNSNLSIGSSIENSSGSSQVYRLTVYPNFNRFGGFKSITLEGDGTIYIANKGATTPIANNLDYDDLGNVPELKVLKEYDIVVTIPNNGEVTGLDFVFQSKAADVSGSISQANVAGLNGRLSSLEGTVNDLFDLVYPVGSIYMSVGSTSPSILFGGTWERIEEKFLLGATTQSEVETTGGSADSVIVEHTHSVGDGLTLLKATTGQVARNQVGSSGTNRGYTWTTNSTSSANAMTSGGLENTGTNGTGKNMPPYIIVNIWKRTA